MSNVIYFVLFTWFLGNMGIHFFTPQLPAMSHALNTSSQLLQMAVSVFLLGKAIGVIVWGPLAERYGRRTFLLTGLALYAITSLAISLSQSIETILILRFCQGLSVSATVLMGRTMINDLFPEKKAIKAFALLFTLAGIIIAFLPMMGSFIGSQASWQVAFYAMAAYASFLWFIGLKALPETRPYQPQTLNFTQILSDYRLVLSNRLFLTYLSISALMVAGESAFNTSASFILIKTHGFSIHHYGLVKTSLAIAHLIGSALCIRAVNYYQPRTLLAIGVTSFLIGSLLMLILNQLHLPILTALLLPMLIYYFGTGFITATVSAVIVRPFPKKMATAMAFCIFLQFITSSGFSFLASSLNIQTAMPLAWIIVFVSGFNFLLWMSLNTAELKQQPASSI